MTIRSLCRPEDCLLRLGLHHLDPLSCFVLGYLQTFGDAPKYVSGPSSPIRPFRGGRADLVLVRQNGQLLMPWTAPTRDAARRDVFEYIEMFYNPQRKHTNNGLLSPVEFERRQKTKLQGV